MLMDKVKKFCDHSIFLWEMAANRKPIGTLWPSLRVKKISIFYSDWPKSWIWGNLGDVRDIFCKCHLHNATKEVFWPQRILNSMQFKSAIFVIFQLWKNGTFEPVHGIQSFFRMTKLKFTMASWIAKIQPKLKKLWKTVKMEQKLSKKPCSHTISKILFNLGSCDYLAMLESKIRIWLLFVWSLF
jgi:hypothetical protein